MQEKNDLIQAYTVREFCRAYGIGRSLTYIEIAAGRLLVRKAGRRTLILKADADAWLASLPVGTRLPDEQSGRSAGK